MIKPHRKNYESRENNSPNYIKEGNLNLSERGQLKLIRKRDATLTNPHIRGKIKE